MGLVPVAVASTKGTSHLLCKSTFNLPCVAINGSRCATAAGFSLIPSRTSGLVLVCLGHDSVHIGAQDSFLHGHGLPAATSMYCQHVQQRVCIVMYLAMSMYTSKSGLPLRQVENIPSFTGTTSREPVCILHSSREKPSLKVHHIHRLVANDALKGELLEEVALVFLLNHRGHMRGDRCVCGCSLMFLVQCRAGLLPLPL